jgi:energy-coupling factor transporter transmembrane protein EcfT
MLARGFTGEMRSYSTFRMHASDWVALAATVVVAAATVPAGRVLV